MKNSQSSKDWLQSCSKMPSHPLWYCPALTHLRPLICPTQPTGLSHPGNPMWLCVVDVFLHLSDLLSQQAPLGSWFSLCCDPLLFLSLGSPASTPLFILPPSFGQTLNPFILLPPTLPTICPPSYLTIHPSIHLPSHPLSIHPPSIYRSSTI